MRLALNFQRIDPSRGGAETYVVDLCHQLVARRARGRHLRRGVDGRGADAPGSRHDRSVKRPRAGPGGVGPGSFARNSEHAFRERDAMTYDCTIGLINTWHHDVIIPQGGVRAGQLRSPIPSASPTGWRRLGLHRSGKQANPKGLDLPGDRASPVRSGPSGPGRRRFEDGTRRPGAAPRHRPRPDSRRSPTRSTPTGSTVADPASGPHVCFRRIDWGSRPDGLVALFVGHNY